MVLGARRAIMVTMVYLADPAPKGYPVNSDDPVPSGSQAYLVVRAKLAILGWTGVPACRAKKEIAVVMAVLELMGGRVCLAPRASLAPPVMVSKVPRENPASPAKRANPARTA